MRLPRTIELWSRRTFDFGDVAAGVSQSVIVTRDVDVRGARWGVLAVRLHASAFTNVNSTITVRLQRRAPTTQDPGTQYAGDADLAAAQIDRALSTPYLAVVPLSLAPGPWLVALVEGLKVTSGSVRATISAAVVLR